MQTENGPPPESLEVQVSGATHVLRRPGFFQWYVVANGGSSGNGAIIGAALVGICWRSLPKLAPNADPQRVEAYARAVIEDLYSRGATASEIRRASMAAIELCSFYEMPSDSEIEDRADFTEGGGG
jgi:hypothetical protein